jgi:hypothetical protein
MCGGGRWIDRITSILLFPLTIRTLRGMAELFPCYGDSWTISGSVNKFAARMGNGRLRVWSIWLTFSGPAAGAKTVRIRLSEQGSPADTRQMS